MEGHSPRLHFPLLFNYEQDQRLRSANQYLDIDFIPAEHNGNLFANALEISVPVGYVFVGNSRCHVKHNDTTLTLDVVSITKSSKLFLTGCIPHVEADGAVVGRE